MRNELDILRPRMMSSFGDWNRLNREMNRFFDDFSDEYRAMRPVEWPKFTPNCDVEDTEDHYVVTVDMPGVDKENIKVEVLNSVLTISGEKKEERERHTKHRYLSERAEGSYFRSLSLPSDVDPEKVEAAYENGVLKVAIPKSPSGKAHQVKIGSGLTNFFGKFLQKKEAQKVKIQ